MTKIGIEEIIERHENGNNEKQNDPTAHLSNYINYDSYTLDGVTKYPRGSRNFK
ncbi:hypothetical protein ACFSO7_09400 [Bacillus sp. CGMCC 1.16607]|uniref:hypothetical protein n=1 Tax=Bacillus sp. CGMCC 1.16607 TaxID=3351842 RepID=UPI00363DAB9D